jgi:hypothetical protein
MLEQQGKKRCSARKEDDSIDCGESGSAIGFKKKKDLWLPSSK